MCLSVRLFVCPTLVFWCQKSRRNSNWVMPYGGTKCRWVMFKLATFDQHLTITRKRCKIGINYCNTVLAGAPRKDKLQITNLEKKKGQITACAARCCAYRHRHLKVWPRPGSDTARRTSLARRPRPGVFQAGSDSSPVYERPCTAIPVGLLRSGRRCRHSAAPAFRQPSTACSTSLPAQHLRPSGFFSCRPHSLELLLGFHPGPDHQRRLFQTFA